MDLQIYSTTKIQLRLIDIRKEDVEEESGIQIEEQVENEKTTELSSNLQIDKNKIPVKTLFSWKFPLKKEIPHRTTMRR